MTKWIANLTDGRGNIIPGFRDELEGTREEVRREYLRLLWNYRGVYIDPDRIDLTPVDRE